MTVQYSGIGLWGRNYKIAEPTIVHYAILPHSGDWRSADVPQHNIRWNEPLLTLNVSNVQKLQPLYLNLVNKDMKSWLAI